MSTYRVVIGSSLAALACTWAAYAAGCSSSDADVVAPVATDGGEDGNEVFIDGGAFAQAVPSGKTPRDCGMNLTTPVVTTMTIVIPAAEPFHINQEIGADGGLLDADIHDVPDASDSLDGASFEVTGGGTFLSSSGADQMGSSLQPDIGPITASEGSALPLDGEKETPLALFAKAQAATTLRTTYSETLEQLGTGWVSGLGATPTPPPVPWILGLTPRRAYTFVLGVSFPSACAKAAFADVTGVDAPVAEDVLYFSTSRAVSDVLVKNGVSFTVAVLTNVARPGITAAMTDAQSMLCGPGNLGACLRLVNALHDETTVVSAEPDPTNIDAVTHQTDPSWSGWLFDIQQ